MVLMNPIDLTKNPYRFFYQKTEPIERGRLYHMHQGMEMYYLHQGVGKALIENQIIEIVPGTILYFSPFQLHGFTVENNIPGALTRSVFEFDPHSFEPYIKPFSSLQLLFYNLWKNQSADNAMIYKLPLDSEWTAQLERLLANLNAVKGTSDYEEYYVLTILTLLKILQPVWRKHYETPKVSSRPQTNAELVMEWIDNHYSEEFSLKAISKDLHLSEKHISTLFRKATRTSVSEYLMAKRLKQACRLLANTTDSIERIAYNVGLTNFSYFCQFFKKRIGVTPLQFRKRFSNHE